MDTTENQPEPELAHKLTPIIRGRDEELALISEHLAVVRDGAGSAMLIKGAAGIGKTRLLEEAQRNAARLGFRLGVDGAQPGDSLQELAPLLGALSSGSPPLIAEPGVTRRPQTGEQRYWVLRAIEAQLEQVAAEGPVLLCLDDLHWAGSGMAAALLSLPSRLSELPIAWVLAYRPDLSPQMANAFEHLRDDGASKIALTPLSASAVAQVTADVMRAKPDESLLAMAGRARGSPYLLAELLAGLHEEALVRVESGHAGILGTKLPSRVRETMRQRMRRLSDTAQQAAGVAASLGSEFEAADLAAMLGLQPSKLIRPIDELVSGGLFIERAGTLAFGHDLTREAVRGSLPASLSRALDRQAADLMLARGALPVDVAMQLAASTTAGDEVAIATLLKAAEALLTTDPDASADLSQRALELTPKDHALHAPLVAQTTVSLHAAGRTEEAQTFADHAVRQFLRPDQEAEVRLGIANMWSIPPDVRVHASQVALELPEVPDGLRASHRSRLAYNLLLAGRHEEMEAALVEATAAHGSADAVSRGFLALCNGGLAYLSGRFTPALEAFENMLREGLAEGHVLEELRTKVWRSIALLALDRASEALELADAVIAEAVERKLAYLLTVAEIWRGDLLLQLGRLDDARAALDGRFVPYTGPVASAVNAAGVVALGRIGLHTGDTRQLRQALPIAHTMINEKSPGLRRHAAWLLALEASANDDARQAHGWLSALGDAERMRVLSRLWRDATDESRLVKLAIAVGDRELAESAAADASTRATRSPDVASLAATAAHARGLLNSDGEELTEAVRLFTQSPRPLALGAALEDLGRARVREGAAQAGIDALSQALVLFTRSGASRDASRLRAVLRELGIRRRVIPAERPTTGWGAMTKSELAVAELVVSGLTNREVAERLFVSPHTVNSHLRQVFAKLEVNSRVELTRLATQRNGRDPEPVR